MVHSSIRILLPQVSELFKKYNVKAAYFFGSVLSEKFNSDSDIDVMVTFMDYSDPLKIGQSIWGIEDDLEILTSRKVDLITERSLKNPYFIQEINNTKELIYGSETT